MEQYEIVNPRDTMANDVLFVVAVSDHGFGKVNFLVWAEDEDDYEGVEGIIVDYLVERRQHINHYVWEPKPALEAMGEEPSEENYDKMVDGQFDDFRMAAGSGDWFIDSHQWAFANVDDDSELYAAALEASEDDNESDDIEWTVVYSDGRVAGVVEADTAAAAVKACAKAYGLKAADLSATATPLIIEVED